MMYVGMVFVSVYVTLGMELVGCVHACACILVCMEASRQPQMSFSGNTIHFFETKTAIGLQFANQGRLDG